MYSGLRNTMQPQPSAAEEAAGLAQVVNAMAQAAENVVKVPVLASQSQPVPASATGSAAAVPTTMTTTASQQQAQEQQPAPTTKGPIYVNIVERKETAGGKPTKSYRSTSGHSHSYIIRFFLVDNHGNHHVAATGIDNGDSHYEYKNEPGFPKLECHNKLEVKRWADAIITESQKKAGYHTDVITDVVPPEGQPIDLPKFISYSESKDELSDGRHLLKWYLLDEQGHNHLALTGEEKETKDGHYTYHTEPLFQRTRPLDAKNQEEVKKWLNAMLVHPQQGLPMIPMSVGAGGGGGNNGGGTAAHASSPPYRHTPLAVHTSGGGGTGGTGTSSGSPLPLRPPSQRAQRPSHPPARMMQQYSVMGAMATMRGAGGRFSSAGAPASGGRRGRGRGRGPGRPPRPIAPMSGGPGSGGYDQRYGVAGGGGGGGGGGMAMQQGLGGGGGGGGGAGGELVRRGRGGWKIIDPDKEARDLIAAELRRWSQEEAIRREAIKNETLSYFHDSLTPGDKETLARVVPQLQAGAGASALPPPTSAGSVAQRRTLVSVLSSLREVSHLRSCVDVVAYPGLKQAVVSLTKSSHKEVSALAASTLEGWLRGAVAHIAVASIPRYIRDPRPELEVLIADKDRFDPVVEAITHKTLKQQQAQQLPSSSVMDGAGGGGGGDGFLTPGGGGMSLGGGGGGQATPSVSIGGGGGGINNNTNNNNNNNTAAGGAAVEQQPMAKRARISMEPAPSAALVDAPALPFDDDGAQILPPFEQQLADRGCDF